MNKRWDRIKFKDSIPKLPKLPKTGWHEGEIVSRIISPTGYIEVEVPTGDVVHVHITDIEER